MKEKGGNGTINYTIRIKIDKEGFPFIIEESFPAKYNLPPATMWGCKVNWECVVWSTDLYYITATQDISLQKRIAKRKNHHAWVVGTIINNRGKTIGVELTVTWFMNSYKINVTISYLGKGMWALEGIDTSLDCNLFDKVAKEINNGKIITGTLHEVFQYLREEG